MQSGRLWVVNPLLRHARTDMRREEHKVLRKPRSLRVADAHAIAYLRNLLTRKNEHYTQGSFDQPAEYVGLATINLCVLEGKRD